MFLMGLYMASCEVKNGTPKNKRYDEMELCGRNEILLQIQQLTLLRGPMQSLLLILSYYFSFLSSL